MKIRSVSRYIALGAVVLLSYGALPAVAHAASPTIMVSPSQGTPGSPVVVSGTGFTGNEAISVTFGGYPAAAVNAQSGAFSVTIRVPSAVAGAYPIVAAGQTSHLTAMASFTVTGSGQTNAGFVLQKVVTVNGLGYSVQGTAQPGDTLTYRLHYANNTGSVLTTVTFTDVLQAGQTPLTTIGAGCTYSGTTRTVTCTVQSIAAGATGDIFVGASVDAGFSGVLTNSAYASTSAGPLAISNSTVVTVGGGIVIPANRVELCGPITIGATGFTVSGVPVSLIPAAPVSGGSLTTGENVCLILYINSIGQAQSVQVGSNLPGSSVVCGFVTGTTTSGSVDVGGLSLNVASNATFPYPLQSGQPYCFLVNSSGQLTGSLSSVPTAAHTVEDGGWYRRGHHLIG